MNKQVYMYHIMFEAKPLPDNPESEDCGGSYINVWVNTEDSSFAMERAKKYIRNEGWEITKVEEMFVTNSQRYEDEPESLECFNEALEYGISALFHIWAKEN